MSENERLENLDRRLEALTHSLELLAQMQIKTDKQIRRLGRYVRTIAVDHEQRLAALEGDEDDE